MAAGTTTKERLERLITAKNQLEAQINRNGQILAANDNVGMNGPLVDPEGFPRNDIDVYQVRLARQTIICLQNDHKELMNQIQTLLNQYHSEIATTDPELVNRASALDLDSDRSPGGANITDRAPARAIVVVNLVSPDSPAERAGLCAGDAILRFGSINSDNFKGDLAQIGELVRNMQSQNVQLKVKRAEQQLDLILVPKTWSGRGLLGCNIVLPPEAMDH
ncbi:26S proteasome non-ATPase regulatory subunit 9 [Drosophila sechellia]|uniref:26S proteasome non-ATPase regulatory subunit 9 n=1 Tax=Drosophila sechellia TaxID=7238 RepID=B4HFQ1_DROSE|nr:26S proteasome non-ATPase regulatory subunit 9 [Drosophila sechellia]EDW42286.1 GM25915 [Drosophila sechellia]